MHKQVIVRKLLYLLNCNKISTHVFLYLVLLSLLLKLRQRAEDHQQKAKQKFRPTEEDTNPNLRFVQNALFLKLIQSEPLKAKFKQFNIDFWNTMASM